MKKYGTATSAFGTNGRINHNSTKFYNSKLYKELGHQKDIVNKRTSEFPPKLLNKVILGTSENMSVIPDNALDLMVTSPPYNVSKEYDQDLSLTEYLNILKKVFQETYRVLVNGGRACINVANLGRKPYIPLSAYLAKIMMDIGFNMRGEIIWDKGASASPSTAWGSWMSASNPILRDTHEYILVFSKGSYKRDRTSQAKTFKTDTISKGNFMEWTKSIWQFSAESAKRIGHPAPFPVALPYRLIQLFSFTNDIILDPFMGSGTTAVAAMKSNRHYIGFDTNPTYIQLAEARIASFNRELLSKTGKQPPLAQHA